MNLELKREGEGDLKLMDDHKGKLEVDHECEVKGVQWSRATEQA